jgi:hypothetical protein
MLCSQRLGDTPLGYGLLPVDALGVDPQQEPDSLQVSADDAFAWVISWLPSVDVRGPTRRSGGYLAGPGAIVVGRSYEVAVDLPIADLPTGRTILRPTSDPACATRQREC